jgi:hypothetical protein
VIALAAEVATVAAAAAGWVAVAEAWARYRRGIDV